MWGTCARCPSDCIARQYLPLRLQVLEDVESRAMFQLFDLSLDARDKTIFAFIKARLKNRGYLGFRRA